MTQFKKDRLANCYCPNCGHEMSWFGSKKYRMVRCIMKECNNTIRFEDAIPMKPVDCVDVSDEETSLMGVEDLEDVMEGE